MSRDRVPTRKGCSRVRRKRFNAFTKNNMGNGINEFGEKINIGSDYSNLGNGDLNIQENGLD